MKCPKCGSEMNIWREWLIHGWWCPQCGYKEKIAGEK